VKGGSGRKYAWRKREGKEGEGKCNRERVGRVWGEQGRKPWEVAGGREWLNELVGLVGVGRAVVDGEGERGGGGWGGDRWVRGEGDGIRGLRDSRDNVRMKGEGGRGAEWRGCRSDWGGEGGDFG